MLGIFTDKLSQFTGPNNFYGDVDPVDLNGGFVAVDKTAADNLSRTQDNINARFDLKQKGGDC